jgi:hypothetical protein
MKKDKKDMDTTDQHGRSGTMKATTQQPAKTMNTTTTREARHQLFSIDTAEADSLRHELFNIGEQDGPLPTEFSDRLNQALTKV